ncbi:MAG: hypothetical protein FWD06_03100 [Oscillospiraceae bacterium]|nr:hypothetical protein [Oscillospiraceae bacterium]
MPQEFPFRPRGKHGFDREDVMNFIGQRQQAHAEQLSQIEELEAAKNAWYTQAKTLEREKGELTTQCQTLEEQLNQSANAPLVGNDAAQTAELNALKARCFELDRQLAQRDQTITQLEQRVAQEEAARESLLAELRESDALPAPQIDSLQNHLDKLAESAEQVAKLQAELSNTQAELQAAKAAPIPQDNTAAVQMLQDQLNAAQDELYDAEQARAVLQRDYEALSQQAEQCQAQLQALQHHNQELGDECEHLRMQLNTAERTAEQALPAPGSNKESSLRGMVLSSFNYANLYVDNNMKTAQLISESTSRNITHVNEASASLLNQVETIAAAFDETTGDIRQQLTTFRQELTALQAGMNYRLSKDRFAPLLEENERLRERIESELNAELSAEERPAAPAPQPVPFAEELPDTYQSFMDDHHE